MAKARELILKALYKIDENGEYSNAALQELLNDRELAKIDKAFAAELTMGVVRNQLKLDYILEQFSNIKLNKLSKWVHHIMRMGIYQLVCMDNIPDSAACNEAVTLAGKYGHSAAKGYVNGVLRNIARNKDRIAYPEKNPEKLSVEYSCPQWLTEKLIDQYGVDETEKILIASQEKQPLTVRINSVRTNPELMIKRFDAENIKAEPFGGSPCCLKVMGELNVNNSQAYKEGLYSLQSISSMKAVEIMAPKAGDVVLDLCAAPGGKSAYCAEMMENRGKVLAMDVHPHKLELIKKTAKRLGLTIIDTDVQNAEIFQTRLTEYADCVLADVPCSGIGVIHKKPDIKWRRTPKDVSSLAEIQRKILQNAARYVKINGVLVYSTCTILQEENQEQTQWFLKRFPMFELEQEQEIKTYVTGGSGFYIAKFVRKK